MNTAPPLVYDAIVVGGGLNGLAVALSLAEIGINTALIDRGKDMDSSNSSDKTRTTTINSNSYDHLGQLGVVAGMAKAGYPITPIKHIRVSNKNTGDGDDAIIEWHDDAPPNNNNPLNKNPLAWVFRNHHLEKILSIACHKHANITVIANTVIADYTPNHPQQGNTAAALYDDNGHVYGGRIIIAADGGNSPIRRMAGLSSISRTPKQVAMVADIKTSKPHHHIAWQRFLTTGPLALMPLDDPHLMALVWTIGNSADSDILLAADDDEFNARLMANVGGYFGTLNVIAPRLHWTLKLSHAITPFAERLVLVGDAAHSIHPLAGQGYNLGLGDAKALVAAITDARSVGTDIGTQSVIKGYARARFVEVTAMTAATDGLNMLFSGENKQTAPIIGAAMTALNATPLKSLMLKWANGG